MALKERNTTRFTARVGTWLRKRIGDVADVLESLLNFRKEDELRDKGVKTAGFAARRALYFVADYWLWWLQMFIAVAMKRLDYSLFEMCIVLWAYDFVAAGLFVVIYEMTGKDLSLGEDLRRATDAIHGKSGVMGVCTTIGVVLVAVVWTGPEKVITFFRKEIGGRGRLVTVLSALTAVQAFLWAALYHYAYEFAMWLQS